MNKNLNLNVDNNLQDYCGRLKQQNQNHVINLDQQNQNINQNIPIKQSRFRKICSGFTKLFSRCFRRSCKKSAVHNLELAHNNQVAQGNN